MTRARARGYPDGEPRFRTRMPPESTKALMPLTWYRLGDVFDATVSTRDGERRFAAWRSAAGPSASLTLGGSHSLMLTLEGIAPEEVVGLPPMEVLARSMIQEGLATCRDARSPLSLRLRTPVRTLSFRGLVCAELLLTERLADAVLPGREVREIDSALQRGLLDELSHDNAGFRLRMRPVREQLRAIQQSGYVPAWRLNAVYHACRDEETGQWADSPLLDADWRALEVQFVPASGRPGFRLTHLFGR